MRGSPQYGPKPRTLLVAVDCGGERRQRTKPRVGECNVAVRTPRNSMRERLSSEPSAYRANYVRRNHLLQPRFHAAER